MGFSEYLMPASSGQWATGPLNYICNDIIYNESVFVPQDDSREIPSYTSNPRNGAIVRAVASLAVSFFSVLDVAYHATACVMKLPAVVTKLTVAKWMVFHDSFPQTLSEDELKKHVNRIGKSVMMVFISLFAGSFNPEIVVAMASKVGYTTFPREAIEEDVLLTNLT